MRNRFDLLTEAQDEHLKQITISRITEAIKEEDIDSDLDTIDIATIVDELIYAGVRVEQFLAAGSRLVFAARYRNHKAVVKLAPSSSQIRANKKENRIYTLASENGDSELFACVYLLTSDGRALVQEYCTDFLDYGEYKKPKLKWVENYLTEEEIASLDQQKFIEEKAAKLKATHYDLIPEVKYKIYECQMGRNSKGEWVYVDYGT